MFLSPFIIEQDSRNTTMAKLLMFPIQNGQWISKYIGSVRSKVVSISLTHCPKILQNGLSAHTEREQQILVSE